ncbi:hypothetical protein F4780DRAFT_776707 [Xylariomycetidae sp. FL0641]|nr:hypothetical protein F4780DRAFT_776707 [Xylariomycetidae sp. FL0641]
MKVPQVLGSVLAAASLAVAAPAPAPSRVQARSPMPSPSDIPSASTAQEQLDGLTTGANEDDGSYDRDLFPHWISVDGCSTRETVLQRDGDGVEVGDDCYPTAGTWLSVYDGEEFDDPSDLDIDHMVPLKNAWISGASEWTTDDREAYANDLTNTPQLWAVSASSNRSKGDDSPDEWKPELESFHCTYAEAWIAVKAYYDLTVTDAERGALQEMLDTC